METILHAIKDYGTQLVGIVLTWFVRKAYTELKTLRETKVKAGLAYEEVSGRVPAIKERYEFWAANS